MHNYTQPTQHTHKQKHPHHDLPYLPASSGLNFIGEWDCCLLCNQSWSLQQGNKKFIDETDIFFILLTLILQASDRCTCLLKLSFFSDYLFIFFAIILKQCTLTPAICWYFLCWCIPRFCHVLPWFHTRHVYSLSCSTGRLLIVE